METKLDNRIMELETLASEFEDNKEYVLLGECLRELYLLRYVKEYVDTKLLEQERS